MQVPGGRRVVWGWINVFPGGRGWNGCLSLPRLLSFSRDGQLHQTPAPQLEKLRGKQMQWRGLDLAGHNTALPLPKTNTLEIQAELTLENDSDIDIQLRSAKET